MADNIPNPTPGAPVPPAPPKKTETGKVQPKKETVRISLPPKPTSAPTIKLPTLPAGGPPPHSAMHAAPASGAAGVAAPAARPPGTSIGRPPSSASAAARPAPAAAAAAPAAPRPAAAPAPVVKPAISGLDLGLSIAAAVVGLGAVVSMVLLLQMK